MKHYIEVRWRQKDGPAARTLINLTRIVTVVDEPSGCKIHMQGYCLNVADSYDEVLGRIAAAEAERSPQERRPQRPGGRPPVDCASSDAGGNAL